MSRRDAHMFSVDFTEPPTFINGCYEFRWFAKDLTIWTAGYWLVRGVVRNVARPSIAKICVRLRSGEEVALTALISKRGAILDMLTIPAMVECIVVSIRSDELPELGCALRFRHLNAVEYRYRQLRRIIPSFVKQSRTRRRRLGLTAQDVLRDLDSAYAAACKLRANVYTHAYAQWFESFYALSRSDRGAIEKHIRRWEDAPKFLVLIATHPDDPEAALGRTLNSLRAQCYDRYEIIEVNGGHWQCALKNWFATSGHYSNPHPNDPWVLRLIAGTQLAEQTLYLLAEAALRPNARVVYTDEDVMDDDGVLSNPIFKPDWSPDYLRATNYISDAFAWRLDPLILRGLLHDSPADDDLYALLLDSTSRKNAHEVIHIAAPLWHRPASSLESRASQEDTAAVSVAAYLDRVGIAAAVEATGAGRCWLKYALPDVKPMVSIVIPTRDGLNYLEPCVSSILAKTTYAPYEVIIMDNQSVLPDTLEYFERLRSDPRIRVIPFNQPFNYSSINNAAVKCSAGEFICLLNNDTEIISPHWLDEMVGLLLQDGVAAVGAKLLYADGTVQHAGDTVGPGGCANHLHSGIGGSDPGYAGRALVVQELSAVTAACLLTQKSTYERLGGLDEKNLAVAFNDVDFCLRVREAGYRVLWTPHAKLFHYESVSRGKDVSPKQIKRARAELKYMRKRWGHVMDHDPFYNPNFSYLQPDFSLSATPGVYRPWLIR